MGGGGFQFWRFFPVHRVKRTTRHRLLCSSRSVEPCNRFRG
jgi:hypothetical protein